MSKTHNIIIALILALTTTACTESISSGPGGPIPETSLAIIDEALAGTTIFTIASPTSSATERLIANATFDAASVGSCRMIRYIRNGQSEAGQPAGIELLGSAKITTIPAKIFSDPAELKGWNADKIRLTSHWMLGNHLCIDAALPFYDGERELRLMVDETSLTTQQIEAWLFHRLPNIHQTFMRPYWFTFDLAEILARSNASTMRVNVCDSNLSTDCFIINLTDQPLNN